MEVGITLFVIRDATNYLESKNLLRSNGTFGTFTIESDATLLGIIEESLKLHGVVVQTDIDKVIKIIPIALALAGVK